LNQELSKVERSKYLSSAFRDSNESTQQSILPNLRISHDFNTTNQPSRNQVWLNGEALKNKLMLTCYLKEKLNLKHASITLSSLKSSFNEDQLLNYVNADLVPKKLYREERKNE